MRAITDSWCEDTGALDFKAQTPIDLNLRMSAPVCRSLNGRLKQARPA